MQTFVSNGRVSIFRAVIIVKMNSLVFQLLVALLTIGFVSANIPISEIETNLDDISSYTSFDQQVNQAMEYTENVIKNIKTAALPATALSKIPYIGSAASGGISSLVTSVTNEKSDDALYKAIGDAAQRSDAKNHISNIQAILQTISQQFNQLRINQLNDVDVISKVHIIHNEFMNIINLISLDDVVLRKYPQFTIKPFSSISILFAIFESIREKYVPRISTKLLACRFQDQIEEYRFMNIFYRFKDMKCLRSMQSNGPGGSLWACYKYCSPYKSASEVINRVYNPNGYNENNFIRCAAKNYCEGDPFKDNGCLKDQDFALHFSNDWCLFDYMALVRHRIEAAYDKSKNVLDDICTDNLRSERKATGYGWLKIIFTFAKGELLPSGWVCDKIGFLNVAMSPCDLYVKLRINGNVEYKTQVIEGTEVAFYEMYQSKKISKDQSYEMKLKDADTIGTPEILITVNGQIGNLITNKINHHRMQFKDNYFDLIVYWRDEYEDEH